MALPSIKIQLSNGTLGAVGSNFDGVFGIAVPAIAVSSTFALNKAYKLTSDKGLDTLGITTANNPIAYKAVKEFYAEAGEGNSLYLFGYDGSVSVSAFLAGLSVKDFISQAGGMLKGLAVLRNTEGSYGPTVTNGLDSDVVLSITAAQTLANWAKDSLFAPLFVLLEGNAYSGDPVALLNLKTYTASSVSVVIGDAVSGGKSACLGTVLGRLAIVPIQRNIGRVKDGALSLSTVYIKNQLAELADVESLHDKGFITFRTYVSKAGYFITDDPTATADTDDYKQLVFKRTIDKAYRIAYATMLNELLAEVPLTAEGKIQAAFCKNWEGNVMRAIINQMSANGELSADTEAGDFGVKCLVDQNQPVQATGKINVVLQVRPYGYAKYITIQLGFGA